MDLVELERKLLEAGRKNLPSDHVPYAFEKRVMARLASLKIEDAWGLWGKALWRGALASVMVFLLLSAWVTIPRSQPLAETDLTEVYEVTVFAAAEQISESW